MVNKGIETLAIHAGEGKDPQTGASSPNLVMSSTFATDQPENFSIKSFEGERPYIYTRWGNPTINILEEKLAALENGEACIAFASGMAATSTVLLGLLESGDHLLISDVNYTGTAELVRDNLARYGISSTSVNTSDINKIEEAVRPNTKLFWIETPANPILRLTDIAAVSELAASHGALVVVDSTLATPIATKPLDLGADLVVHSLTKYLCGHGDALGGAVIGSQSILERLRSDALVHLGGVISPFNAWLINRGIATLPARMHTHEANATAVAKFLYDHPAVTRVNYPGHESHPQHDLAKRQMDNFSGLLSFQVRDNLDLAERMAKELETIHFAVSFGHHRSLICWIDTKEVVRTSFKLTEEQEALYRESAGNAIFRFSAGLENPDDLCGDLATVLGN